MLEIRVLARYGDTCGSIHNEWFADYASAFRRAGEIRAADPYVPIAVERRDQDGHWTHHYSVQGVPIGGY